MFCLDLAGTLRNLDPNKGGYGMQQGLYNVQHRGAQMSTSSTTAMCSMSNQNALHNLYKGFSYSYKCFSGNTLCK